MNSVAPFRVTPEDLPDLDKKTRNGLQPLLDSLNVTLNQLVPAINSTAAEPKNAAGSCITDENGSVYIMARPTTSYPPKAVYLDQLALPNGGDISTVFGFTWQLTQNYVRVLLVGLLPSTTYRYTLSMK